MHEDDVRDQIAQYEARIESLTAAIARCRKISLAARLAVAAGAILGALTLVGALTFEPAIFFAALAAVLGGIVLLGSNATTWTQADADLHAAEAARAQLIGAISLRVVGEDRPLLH